MENVRKNLFIKMLYIMPLYYLHKINKNVVKRHNIYLISIDQF